MHKQQGKTNVAIRDYEKSISITLSIILTFLIFSTSLYMVFFDRSFYDDAYAKHGAYTEIGPEGVRAVTDGIINYMMSENKDPYAFDLQAFSQKEIEHLQDVHFLFRLLKYLTLISLITLFGFGIYSYTQIERGQFFELIRKVLRLSAYISLGSLVLLTLLSINFTWFWDIFHKVLFPQGNYAFPASSLLIILFPEGFFHDFAYKMFFHVIILTVVVYFLGSRMKK